MTASHGAIISFVPLFGMSVIPHKTRMKKYHDLGDLHNIQPIECSFGGRMIDIHLTFASKSRTEKQLIEAVIPITFWPYPGLPPDAIMFHM